MNIVRDIKINNALRCPICKAPMGVREDGAVLFCEGTRRHAYDFASAGYVNLSAPGQSNGGDAKLAVRARSAFLDKEYYRPVADKLCELTLKYTGEDALAIDAGCGEGYYSVSLASYGVAVAGFDLSKFAADAAAKRARRVGVGNAFFGVASVYSMPLADGCADAVVNVFAPCVEAEYSRVLDGNGVLIVVYAGPDHLKGLKEAIYDKVGVNDGRADLPKEMAEIECQRLKYRITVEGNSTVKDLFAMTPYYWRTSVDDVKKLDGVERLETDIDMIFAVYGKQRECDKK